MVSGARDVNDIALKVRFNLNERWRADVSLASLWGPLHSSLRSLMISYWCCQNKISKSALKSSNLDCSVKLNLSIGGMKRNCVWHVWRSFVCPPPMSHLCIYLFYPRYIEAIEFQISVSTLKARHSPISARAVRFSPYLAARRSQRTPPSPTAPRPTKPPSSFLTILNPSLLNPLRLRE